jgi:hypothetical protein
MVSSGRVVCVLIALGLLVASCNDDKCDKCPVVPGTSAPTFDNIWPHADSTSWTFLLVQRSWEDSSQSIDIYPTREEVPPAPTLDEVVSRIRSPHVADSAAIGHALYRLRFEGEITTESGAHGQNLVERIYEPGPSFPVAQPPSQGVLRDRASGIPCSFLDRLRTIRPDLRDKLPGSFSPMAASASFAQRGPIGRAMASDKDLDIPWLFLHGYAWTQTNELIGNYGDLSAMISWEYLERDISVSHEFSLRLVPELADDIWLYGKILPRRSIRTEAGTFADCVECVYMVDYGISTVTDETGHELGFFRVVDYASIIYAADIGPVFSYQWNGSPFQDRGIPIRDFTISLIGTGAGSR